MTTGWHSFMRVDPPEGLLVRPKVTRGLAEVGEVLPRVRDAPVDAPGTVGAAIARSADDVAEGAAAAAQAAQREPIGFIDLIAAKAHAFLVLELHIAYQKWRHARPGDWQAQLTAWRTANPGAPAPPAFTPDRRVEHVKQLQQWTDEMLLWAANESPPRASPPARLPLDYATGERSGRPHQLLTVLFGEGYRNAIKVLAGKRAPRKQLAPLWPRLVACVWPAADATSMLEVVSLLKLSRTSVRSKVADVIARTGVVSSPESAEQTTDMILALVARYAPNGDIGQLTEEALLELTGKPMTLDEFIHRSVLATSMMADEADLLGIGRFKQLLEVEGIESFLAMVLQKSGYEHGYTFEVFLVLRELVQSDDPASIWMQLVVGGRQGPDIGRIIDDVDGRRVRLIQAKSYGNIQAVMRPTASGEIFKQMRSDLLRLSKEGFMVTGPDGTKLPIDRTIEFSVDWFHLRWTSFRIPGITTAELHALHEATPEVQALFKARYMDDEVKKLQAYLDSPAFRAELGLGEGEPGFVLDVKIVDRILPDEP